LTRQLSRRLPQLTRGHDAIDEPERECTIGAHVLAGQHQVHRRRDADQSNATHGAAESRMYPQQDLGQTEHRLRVVDEHAMAAGECELEATAEAEAVDRGHGRAGQALQPRKDRMSGEDPGQRVLWRADLLELVDIRARDEARLARGQHDAVGALALDLPQARIELVDHVARQRIGGGVSSVEREPRDAVVVERERPVARQSH